MPYTVQSRVWKSRRAVVLVHGVGDYVESDYATLLEAFEQVLGPAEWGRTAVYTVLYDQINDWMRDRLPFAAGIRQLIQWLTGKYDRAGLAEVAAEGAGDIVWPVLSLAARGAIRDAIIAQLQQVVLDGVSAGYLRDEMEISIVCHSLGCFHTFEALSEAASNGEHDLQPVTDFVRFRSVVMMASPVQLIASVAREIRDLVPSPGGLASLKVGSPLEVPGERDAAGNLVYCARRFVAVTGDLDPVGGHLMRRQLDWAYMDLKGQEPLINHQRLANVDTEDDLARLLREALSGGRRLPLSPNNPHDWVAYVKTNAGLVRSCLVA